MIYDDLDNHIAVAGSIEKAAVPMGMYLAWCVNLQLVGKRLHVENERALLRVRYREMRGSDLLVSACGGTLRSTDLNDAGRAFTDRYYASYLDEFRAVFGSSPYEVEDDWPHYDKIAPVFTERYMRRGRAKGRSWWKFWQSPQA